MKLLLGHGRWKFHSTTIRGIFGSVWNISIVRNYQCCGAKFNVSTVTLREVRQWKDRI